MLPRRLKKASKQPELSTIAGESILKDVSEFLGCLFPADDQIAVAIGSQHPLPSTVHSILSLENLTVLAGINYHESRTISVRPTGDTLNYLSASCNRMGGLKQVQRRLAATNLPIPTMTIKNNPGVTLIWKLTKAITENQWVDLQLQIAHALGADVSTDLLLPGLINHVPQKFRTVQKVTIEEHAPDRVYDPDIFPVICRRNQVAQFISVLWKKSDTVNLRLISSVKKEKPNLFIRANEILHDVNWSRLEQSNKESWNIYSGVNPVCPDSNKRGRKEGVQSASALFLDFDPAPDNYFNVISVQHKLSAIGMPEPTMMVSSGRGLHVYWKLSEPMTNLPEWSSLQKRLIDRVNNVAGPKADKAIFDAPRIMRLPGFVNQKPSAKSALCDILWVFPKNTYLTENLSSIRGNSSVLTPKYDNLGGAPVEEGGLSIRLPLTDTEQNYNVSNDHLNELVKQLIWMKADFNPRKLADRHTKRIALSTAVHGRCPGADIDTVMESIFKPWFSFHASAFPDKTWAESAKDFYLIWAGHGNENYFNVSRIMAGVDVTLTVREKIKILMTRASAFFKMPNGTFHLSHRQMALGCGCTRRAAEKALFKLIRDKFVIVTKQGERKKINGLANQYRLV